MTNINLPQTQSAEFLEPDHLMMLEKNFIISTPFKGPPGLLQFQTGIQIKTLKNNNNNNYADEFSICVSNIGLIRFLCFTHFVFVKLISL